MSMIRRVMIEVISNQGNPSIKKIMVKIFERLKSKKTIIGEDETEVSELKYLSLIKDIRDSNPDLFDRIKKLPRKGRSGKKGNVIASEAKQSPADVEKTSKQEIASAEERRLAMTSGELVTYFRKGKVQKFFMANNELEANELDFMTAAETLECEVNEKKKDIPDSFFDLLDKNKDAFVLATTEDGVEPQTKKGRDSTVKMLRILKAVFPNTKQLTEEQEEYLRKVIEQLKEGGFPKQTIKTAVKALDAMKSDWINPMKVLAVLQKTIPAGCCRDIMWKRTPMRRGSVK